MKLNRSYKKLKRYIVFTEDPYNLVSTRRFASFDILTGLYSVKHAIWYAKDSFKIINTIKEEIYKYPRIIKGAVRFNLSPGYTDDGRESWELKVRQDEPISTLPVTIIDPVHIDIFIYEV